MEPNKQYADQVAILIPCHNEEKTIGKVIDDWKAVLPDAVIYVYDNCCTDKTAEIAQVHGAIVRFERRKGKGRVIRRMFREIDALCYIMVDGDDTYGTENAERMVKLVLDRDIDMVIGDRLSSTYFTETTRRFHSTGNAVVRQAINFLFDSDVRDIMTGCRAFSFRFVKSYPVLSYGFEVETEMTIHALDKQMDIVSLPVSYKERDIPEESKLRTIPDGIKVLKTIFNLYRNYRPLAFFSLLALILCILSTIFIVPVLTEYHNTGFVSRFPTLFVCCFTYLGSLVSFFSGLILDAIHRMELRQAEIHYAGLEKEFAGLEKELNSAK